MKKKRIIGAVLLIAIAAAVACFKQSKRAKPEVVADSPRAEQQTASGTSVVEEWGEESFPASDPPQSW